MGRYISGDINGKFWFGLQPSDAADRFGVTGYQPEELYYYFDKEDLNSVEEEISLLEENLKDVIPNIKNMFKNSSSWSTEILAANNVTQQQLSDYVDLQLGYDIRDCIKENGSCEFVAEC